MKKSSKRKSSAANILITPPSITPTGSPIETPKLFKFSSISFTTPTSLKKDIKINNNNNSSKKDAADPATETSPAPAVASPSKTRNRIADLKEIASSHVDSIKRQIDCSYSDLLKDIEASYSRLQKRYKVQNQACAQSMEETAKDFKKVMDHMSRTHDTMEASYMDIIAKAESRATRICNTSIPELKQSVEKAIDQLRSHYAAASTNN
ncbi:uncharacterized protein [Rutidosis leptorrhynchoides]|uniref:uncharacterized protein n=1 Tax=Rutidosis leptorrhynchoides TaxID=125765 RepID=UPI003A9A2BA9